MASQFIDSNGKKLVIGDKIKCIKPLKAPMLPGGFTEGREYPIIKFQVGAKEVSVLDDEKNEFDPMDMDSNCMLEHFGFSFNVSKI